MTPRYNATAGVVRHADGQNQEFSCAGNSTPKGGYPSTWVFTALNGKVPITKSWTTAPGLTPDEIRARRDSGQNIGLVTGERSGRLLVVDIDGERPEGLPDTVEVVTGSGGAHLYYTVPEGVEIPKANKVGHVAPGVDIRYTGGQVVYPGSVHPGTGAVYEWAPGKALGEIPLVEVPGWVIDALLAPKPEPPRPTSPAMPQTTIGQGYTMAALTGAAQDARNAAPGTRNALLNTKAYALAGLGIDAGTIEAHLLPAALDAGLPEGEARKTIHSGTVAGQAAPRDVSRAAIPMPMPTGGGSDGEDVDPMSDLAGSLRLLRIADGDLRHATDRDWLVFDGKRFAPDEKQARRLAAKVGQATRADGHANTDDPDAIKAYYRTGKRFESAGGIDALLKIAATLPGIDADHVEFDADPWALNCENGTVDLNTGELRPQRRSDHITKLCPHEFIPVATCPRWLAFLDEIFEGDKELIQWVQWLCGYSATGSTHRHIFPILHGDGRNGKGAFFRAMRHVLGTDYAAVVETEDLMMQHNTRHSVGIAQLRGIRFAFAQETEEGRRLNESLVKSLTGGDIMKARMLYGQPFEFTPTHTLWMASNYRPRITGTASGIWERLRLLPFNRQFSANEQDPFLDEKLRREATGILAWIVAGARMPEPSVPGCVKAATDDYRDESDTLAAFIDDALTEWEHTHVLKRDVYDAYRSYMNNHCEDQRRFNQRIAERGFVEKKIPAGMAWEGVSLRVDWAKSA